MMYLFSTNIIFILFLSLNKLHQTLHLQIDKYNVFI